MAAQLSVQPMQANAIRTLIVDDEAPARQWLRTLCSRVTDLMIMGECSTAGEASRILHNSAIDLLLLDIQLGPYNGFQVLDGVAHSAVPTLVFVTAHDQYAVRAFERRAVDYLIKPVQEDRFNETLERVRRHLRGGLMADIRAAMRESIGPLERSLLKTRTRGYSPRLIAERGDIYRVIECCRIVMLDSEGNYVRVTEKDAQEPAFMRGTLHSVMAVLDPESFVRINRSVIVNLDYVDSIARNHDGHLIFVMKESGQRINVGRSYHHSVVRLLKLEAP